MPSNGSPVDLTEATHADAFLSDYQRRKSGYLFGMIRAGPRRKEHVAVIVDPFPGTGGPSLESTSNFVVWAKHHDAGTQKTRETAAQNVLAEFAPVSLRTLFFFDNEDSWELKNLFGAANRGLSGPARDPTSFRDWPWHVVERLFRTDCITMTPLFDFLIYLHDSAAQDEVGLTMTFAHEFQHLMQYVSAPDVWEANNKFKEHRETLAEFLNIRSHQLPMEHEARIVAKKIATKLHGEPAVKCYIDRNIAKPLDDLDAANWRFVRDLDILEPYNLKQETKRLMRQLAEFLPLDAPNQPKGPDAV